MSNEFIDISTLDADQLLQLIRAHFEGKLSVHNLHSHENKVNIINSSSGRISGIRYMGDSSKLPFQFGQVSCSFSLSRTDLTTLVGCPAKVGSAFTANYLKLSSLEGGPQEVGRYYGCEIINGGDGIDSLNGLPKTVGEAFHINISKYIAILKLLTVKCSEFKISEFSGKHSISKSLLINQLMNHHRQQIENGTPFKKALWDCQNDLIANGFENYAKW
jgi:hypothetical protein